MIRFIIFSAILPLFFFPHSSAAQIAFGEVTDQPICFNLVSEADNGIYGRVMTNYFQTADGQRSRHRSNFRLEPGMSKEVCTSGPFFEGRKVEIIIQTFIPVFNCKSAVTGDIIFKDERDEDGTLQSWAECLE